MIDLLHRCFPDQVQSAAWQEKLRTMIPSYGRSLASDPDLLATVRERTTWVLRLTDRLLQDEPVHQPIP
jgi:malate dehydrogenase (quinone)